jgi:hypothetical protein
MGFDVLVPKITFALGARFRLAAACQMAPLDFQPRLEDFG